MVVVKLRQWDMRAEVIMQGMQNLVNIDLIQDNKSDSDNAVSQMQNKRTRSLTG